ncbi:hypothetical protein AN639_11410 [Candidatus Epulonipiscium fishelsonii]|nr:hypothetical protein AN639_11410 [Epulopiscium sp. SCG-B05WGA-EpuloA1]
MNVYKFEFLSIRKSLITWCIILAFTYYFLIAGIYPMFADGMKLVKELIEYMPPEYLLVFGLDVENMVDYNGFYSFSYIYIALVAGVMATSITANVFGKEKKSYCQEFLFSKPIKRQNIFKVKLLVILTAVLIFNVIAIAISLFCFDKYGTLDNNAILAIFSITFCQLVFVGLSTFIVVFIPKIRSTATISATVGLLAFTIEVFINALRIKCLEFFSPLHFFTPKSVFESGGFDFSLSIYAIAILIISIGVSAVHFIKADLGKL